jgi:uncharacterized protein (TIGR02118 family)
MIRVSVRYPVAEGGRFDMGYYLKSHTPMVIEKLTPLGMTKIEVDEGIRGLMPGTAPGAAITAYLYFETEDQFNAALSLHGLDIMADMANYTDAKADIQVNRTLAL